jgi:ADP-heptose:LPS heptosyltransferase
LQSVEFRDRIHVPDPELDGGADGFVDTAAVVSLLDLVITSDTGLAHIAGALGRPVWMALNYAPDWRWLLARADTPWYPTLRIFRQSRPREWRSVFASMADQLQRRLAPA